MSRLPEDLERLLHDLRGPLNALAMHAEVLKRAIGADDPAAASVRTIQQESERLAAMLVSAMRVVALERTESARIDLRSVVKDAMTEASVNAVLVADGDWADVVGDRRLLTIAVTHLLRNAGEATAAAGAGTPPPEVSVQRKSGTASLVVRDYGAGLRSTNPKVLIRLHASPKPGHEGIGLVTVERVARLHGGSLGFDAAGPGARVTLHLPAAGGA
jgi:signal transduction histidine kinase